MTQHFAAVDATAETVHYQTLSSLGGYAEETYDVTLPIIRETWLPTADFLALTDAFVAALRDAIAAHRPGDTDPVATRYFPAVATIPEVTLP